MFLDEVSLTSPINDPVVSPFFISLTCGQDVTIPTLLEISFLIISCSVMSGVRPLTREIYKDGVLISNSSFDVSVMSPGNDDFGTYTFVVSSEGCGSAFAVSRIQGQFLNHCSYQVYQRNTCYYNMLDQS